MAINLLYLLGVVPDVYRRFSFMLARDIEMFIEHCGLKGLSTKTINSYEQTLMSMSKSAVYDQLTSEYGEQFTASQAQYAIDHLD